MNKYQKAYIIALAQTAYAKDAYNQVEKEYIKAKNIKNSDGSVPECLYDIEDYDTFNTAYAALESVLNALRIPQHEARLKRAEDKLIAYALSYLPHEYNEQREKLRTIAKDYSNYKERDKILEYALSIEPAMV